MDCNLAFINRLAHACTRRIDFIDRTPEGILLLVNLSKQVSELLKIAILSTLCFLEGRGGGVVISCIP